MHKANSLEQPKDGMRMTYHDNGRIKEQGQTYMGERDGKWKFYNSKGQLSKTIHYLVGDIIKQDTSL